MSNEEKMFYKLDKHDHIAYDLDGTLFGLYGNALRDYIQNHPEKTHSIVTSRQSTCANMSELQLKNMFGDILPLPFKHVIHSPSHIYEGHQVNPSFKGEACKRIGATALIDDWQVHKAGCIANDIEFVFIHDLT